MTTPLHTVPVALGDRSYTIHIGRGLLSNVASLLPFKPDGRKIFILTDENTVKAGETVRESLSAASAGQVEILTLPAGEGTKSLTHLETVLHWLLDYKVSRDSVLFAVGGGVIGDIGGFAASITLRGIPFVQVPTTLLSAVDSSVGGKTGINTSHGKNLVGAFYQPATVICDLDMLDTLPDREMKAGYAEVVKYGLINDPEFFIWLETHGKDVLARDTEALAKAVEISCRKKAEIVAEDEREKGMRALLNLGHTFGHALEAAAGYDGSLLHGEAVSIGMVLAFRLSARLGLCPDKEVERVERHLESLGLPVAVTGLDLKYTPSALVDLMAGDKKVSGGRLTFILARGIGKAFVTQDVERTDVEAVIGGAFR